MVKEMYVAAETELIAFETEDVITASDGEIELPPIEFDIELPPIDF